MNYEATALKSIFTELITLDISRNINDYYQLKQDAIENVWLTIDTLDKNAVSTLEIQTSIDNLKCTISFLEDIQTGSSIDYITSEIKRVIDMLKREIL